MKQRKIAATLLIVLGIAVCAMGIGFHAAYLYKDVYLYHIDCCVYDSFADVFLTDGLANFIVSVILGSVCSAIGICMLCRKPWWYKA